MPVKQVISVSAFGEISGLQVKPGKGVDLTTLGKAEVKRASEILWDEAAQKWFVQIVKGRYSGHIMTCLDVLRSNHCEDAVRPLSPEIRESFEHTAFYETYDAAVSGEIKYLDYVRLNEGSGALA